MSLLKLNFILWYYFAAKLNFKKYGPSVCTLLKQIILKNEFLEMCQVITNQQEIQKDIKTLKSRQEELHAKPRRQLEVILCAKPAASPLTYSGFAVVRIWVFRKIVSLKPSPDQEEGSHKISA